MNGLRHLALFLFGLTTAFFAAPNARAEEKVDLELVLAIDVSGSVDPDEARLQRDGYVSALKDADVVRAITAGFRRAIAVSYIEWAGDAHISVVSNWVRVDGADSANQLAARLSEEPLTTGLWTSISGIIEFALPRFEDNGFIGTRRVIDISGDGANNDGLLVTVARDAAIEARVTINGLPIVNDRLNPFGRKQIPNLDLYYRHCVIGGAGAFLVVAKGFKAFAQAIKRKLIFEIAGFAPPGGTLVIAPPPRPEDREPRIRRADLVLRNTLDGPHGFSRLIRTRRTPPPCDIGERLLEQRRRFFDDF
ncbi:MAG: DUF1194 domain-containing protein [Rhodospirillales bacterium]|nr:DUF1194 domain-containing protein [Rhodospirillales bacterium]